MPRALRLGPAGLPADALPCLNGGWTARYDFVANAGIPPTRVPAYAERVQAAPHPAYVFDLTTSEVAPSVPAQVAGRIAAHAPRLAGYSSVVIGGYVVFYFAGVTRRPGG